MVRFPLQALDEAALSWALRCRGALSWPETQRRCKPAVCTGRRAAAHLEHLQTAGRRPFLRSRHLHGLAK
jgi:hypothetical protein